MYNYEPTPSSFKSYGSGNVSPSKPLRGFAQPPRRTNIAAILLSWSVPTALFVSIFAVISFSFHYHYPALTWLIVVVGVALTLWIDWLAVKAVRRRLRGDAQAQGIPAWYIFWALSMVVAFTSAYVAGSWNYWNNTYLYCEANRMTSYKDVDPKTATGGQLMDAGRATFTESTHIDGKHFISFKNTEAYCVAPIVDKDISSELSPATKSYDLWAVGQNCCATDYHCGEFANTRAHAGLRVVREEEAKYYELAVKQAEAAYNIRSVHPIFFYWMQDPAAELTTYQDDAVKLFVTGCAAFVAYQILVTTIALLITRKCGLD